MFLLRSRLFIAIIIAAAALLAALAAERAYFTGGQSYEFCHYSEVAANINAGRGFSTSVFYPSTLAFLDARGVTPEPSGPTADRFPLQAYWVALNQKIFGVSDTAALAAGIIAHAAWCAAVFLCGAQIFGTSTAAAAALLLAVNPMMTAGYNLTGYPDTLFAIFFLLFNFQIMRRMEGQKSGGARGFALGLTAGLAYLARFSFILWLPVCAAMLVFQKRRKELLSASAGFGCVALPWMIYYYSTTGFVSPPVAIWNLADKTLAPGIPWLNYASYSWTDFMSAGVLSRLLFKWVYHLSTFMVAFPFYWFLYIAGPLALVWVVVKKETESREKKFFLFWLGLLFWQAALFSALRYESLGFMDGRYYLWFAPAALLAGTHFAATAFPGKWKTTALSLFVASTLLVYVYCYARIDRSPGNASGLPVKDWPELQWIRENTASHDIILTNIPAQVTWYCGRPAVNIPNAPQQVPQLLARHNIRHILITSARAGQPADYPAWLAVLDGKNGGLEAFEKATGFSGRVKYGPWVSFSR